MTVEPTGIVLVGICDVQSAACTARMPSAITAVWAAPGRQQINVCRCCLDEQVRAGEWEIQGARLSPRIDIGVVDASGKLIVVAEVKFTPAGKNTAEWATHIRRNLLAHGAVPRTKFFLLIAYPGDLFLWYHEDHSWEAKPDLHVADADLFPAPDLNQLPTPAKELEYERVVAEWLRNLAADSSTSSKSSWLTTSGLIDALRGGKIVRQLTWADREYSTTKRRLTG